MRAAAVALALATVACDHHAQPRGRDQQTGDTMTTLTLTAHSDAATFAAGAPIPLHVTLANPSTRPVWINQRLGLGYEDALFRELFITVRDERGAVLAVRADQRRDAHRMPPARADFRELAAGDSVAATVDIAPWLPALAPGRYQVTVTYHNDDSGQAHGLAAFTGAVAAAPVAITLR